MRFLAPVVALLSTLAAGATPSIDTPAWSCAAYCRYQSNFEILHKSLVADGTTLSAAFKALTDQCDALQGILVGGSIAGAGQQNSSSFSYGIPAATQSCAKN
jgi:hypothetical protein